jgi:hypothetical protein
VHAVPLIPRAFIERKAGQIVDPVERLRYLQRTAGIGRLRLHPPVPWRKRRWPALGLALLLACLLIPGRKVSGKASHVKPGFSLRSLTRVSAASAGGFPDVWLVDKTSDFETYSNGLRIDDRFTAPNQKRVFYPVYQRGAAVVDIDAEQPEWRSEPAGIGVVQQNHSYHFLIDRFGQVFRIVPEQDVANHAGYSIWSDESVIFVNLNSSFLGIAFETQTHQGDLPSANPAQIHAARILTDMLRNKYRIPQSN